VAWQGPRDIAVLNLDDPSTVALHTGAASEVRGFSLSLVPKRGAHLDQNGNLVLVSGDRRTVLCKASELRVPGRHNVANALAAAVGNAREMARPGDVVLLSPANASFDMFSSADERGEKFAAIVRSFTS